MTTRDKNLPITLTAYRLLRAWDESAVTWESAGPGSWQIPGAHGDTDRATPPVATVTVDQAGGWVELDVTDAVIHWLNNPTTNFGLLLTGSSEGGVQYTFLSSEWVDVSKRPRLIIDYVVVTPTPTPTPTPTFTPTPTPTFTPTPTWTATPTFTPTPTFTATRPPGTPTPPWPTPTPGPKRLDVLPRSTPVSIDGVLDEWNIPPAAYLSSSSADTVVRIVPSLQDLAGWLWSAWDTEYLYFAVHIVDDHVIGQDSQDVWRDDGVEIAVDGSPDGKSGSDHHQITLVSDGRATDFGSQPLPAGTLYAVRRVPGGYIAELALPWSALGISTPAGGQVLNFTWGVHDDDDGGDWDSYLIWAGSSTVAADQGMAPLILAGGTIPPTATPTPTSTRVIYTVSFQDGSGTYNGTRDVTLNRWLASTPLGKEAVLQVRSLDEATALVNFALDTLPSGIRVEQAKLALYMVRRSMDGTVTLRVYSIRRPWQENEATWLYAAERTPWAQPGGLGVPDDREGTPVDEVLVTQRVGWVNIDVTQAVQEWVENPESAFGLLLRAEAPYPVEILFTSREWLSVQVRPRLEITYSLP